MANPPVSARRARRRRLGYALLAFGGVGAALVVAAAALVLGSLSAVDNAATSFEQQRAHLVAMIAPTRAALADAATSASNAGASLDSTSAAATRAARLTDELASSFDGLAALGSVDILGARPFAGTSSQFAAAAADARGVSADLNAAATSMQTNISDSRSVASDLQSLADELGQLEATLGPEQTATSSLPIDAARLVLIGLLTWLAVPAIASLWVGARLVRRSRG
jgi:hypothetical protein